MTAEELHSWLGAHVDMVMEGGATPGQIESTILDVSGASPLLIRRGAVGEDAIREYLAELGEDLVVA